MFLLNIVFGALGAFGVAWSLVGRFHGRQQRLKHPEPLWNTSSPVSPVSLVALMNAVGTSVPVPVSVPMNAPASRPEEGTLKRLRDGTCCPAVFQCRDGNLLLVDVPSGDTRFDTSNAFSADDLFELRAENTLYLGSLEFREGRQLGIRYEHSLDLALAGRIRNRWGVRGDSRSSSPVPQLATNALYD